MTREVRRLVTALALLGGLALWLFLSRTGPVDPVLEPERSQVEQPQVETLSAPTISVVTTPVTVGEEAGEPVHWERLDLLPELGWRVRGEFPEELREVFPRLEVPVRLLVGVQGSVQQVEILELPHPAFEQPTLEAAAQFLFRPGIVDGIPHPFVVETFVFFDPLR